MSIIKQILRLSWLSNNVRTYLFASLLFAAPYISAQNKMCITVDDLPVVKYGISDIDHHKYITNKLIQTFKKYDAPAIGYVNSGKVHEGTRIDSAQVELLNLWLENGLELGNHTYSHSNYHRVTFEEFVRDITNGEKVIVDLAAKHNSSIQYFRHPFLRSGSDKESTNKLSSYLKQRGYIEAPVTIDNDDYLFAQAYSRAFQGNDVQLMKKIGEAYVDYMVKKAKYFEVKSEELFGRNMNHILLVHASLLNADYMDKLLAAYSEMGYEFISQAEALEDEIYSTEVTRFGDWGISWIDRWALSRGKKGDFFKDDPRVPDFISN